MKGKPKRICNKGIFHVLMLQANFLLVIKLLVSLNECIKKGLDGVVNAIELCEPKMRCSYVC